MFTHFTASARRVMQRAFREAKRRQHDFVGTEHLLYGLLCDADGPAVALLLSLGARPELMLQKVELSLERHATEAALEQFPLSPASRRVFVAAKDVAARLHHQLICPEHILIGLMRETECEAAQILSSHGVALDALWTEVAGLPTDAFREAQIHAHEDARGPLGDNPSVDELQRWLAPAITHDDVSGDPATTAVTPFGPVYNVDAIEAQLRRTQVAFGFVLGYAYGYWLSGWWMGLILAGAGLCVALFRSTMLGVVGGAVCGLFITPIFRDQGPLVPVWIGLVGAFLGSFLGDVWRFTWTKLTAQPPPDEEDHPGE